jgi:hypothetical protein
MEAAKSRRGARAQTRVSPKKNGVCLNVSIQQLGSLVACYTLKGFSFWSWMQKYLTNQTESLLRSMKLFHHL